VEKVGKMGEVKRCRHERMKKKDYVTARVITRPGDHTEGRGDNRRT